MVYYLLGKVYKKLGQEHLALMNLSRATDMDPRGAYTQIKESLDPIRDASTSGRPVGIGEGAGGGSPGQAITPVIRWGGQPVASHIESLHSTPQQDHGSELFPRTPGEQTTGRDSINCVYDY